jgi:hypothetical protein
MDAGTVQMTQTNGTRQGSPAAYADTCHAVDMKPPSIAHDATVCISRNVEVILVSSLQIRRRHNALIMIRTPHALFSAPLQCQE